VSKNNVTNKEYLSVAEAAKILGYSRQHVHRLIDSGEIKASKVGRSYIILRKDLPTFFGDISKTEKQKIDKAVDKVFKHYEETIKKLGEE